MKHTKFNNLLISMEAEQGHEEMGFSERAKTETFNDDGHDSRTQHGQNQGKINGKPHHGETPSEKGPEHEDIPMGNVEHV